MEIVRERLEREFDLDLIVTAPNVAYRVQERTGGWVEVHNPAATPKRTFIKIHTTLAPCLRWRLAWWIACSTCPTL